MKKVLCCIALMILVCLCFAACTKGDGYFTGSAENSIVVGDGVNRKLVYNVGMDVRAKDVNSAVKTILAEAQSVGGFVQSQEMEGDGDDVDNALLTLRIPTDKLDEFVSAISNSGKVASKSVRIDDITDRYIDATAEKTALLANKAALSDMLSDTGLSASDKITVLSEIAKIDEKLETLNALLTQYDSMVEYSTVNLNIYERNSAVADSIFGVFFTLFAGGLIASVIVLAICFGKAKRRLNNINKQ